MLAVVVQHGVVEGIDALEILRVERVLRTDAVRGLGPQVGLQQLQDRPQNRQAGQAQFTAVLFKPAQQLVIEQRIEHDAWRFLDLGQDSIELLLRAHQRIDMFDR